MANQRIFYATHSVNVAGGTLAGVQSVSLNSNFNLEPAFQLGQLSHVELYPNNPSIEATITRALVGSLPFTIDVTDSNVTAVETLLQTPVTVGIGVEGGGGFSIPEAFISSYSVNFATDGLFTEELGYAGETITASSAFGAPSPAKGHVPRRMDFTISGAGVTAGLTSASFSVNFNRESVYKLGQFDPFLRTVTFPVESTLQYTLLLPEGDVSVVKPTSPCTPISETSKTISIGACGNNWTIRNARLSSVNYSGGDTGGGNVEVQYTYSSYNDFKIG